MISELAPSSLLHFEGVSSGVQELLKRSRAFLEEGEWALAEGCARDAEDACRRESDHTGLAIAQLHLADIYREVGELGKAIGLCEAAYRILHGQAAEAQRHNEAVAAYIQGIIHETLLFGDYMRAVNWYQRALELFEKAKEHWASHRHGPWLVVCERVYLQIEERKKKIVSLHADERVKLNPLTILPQDCTDAPFAVDSETWGCIIDDDQVSIDGVVYDFYMGRFPTVNAGDACRYFLLPVPEDQWIVQEAEVGDYVIVRQHWEVDEERLGVVWEPGLGWRGVRFERGRDGKTRFYHQRPQVIGGDFKLLPPGDPAGKLRGCIVALLKPVQPTLEFAGIIIEGLGADSTLVVNKAYKLSVGFPREKPGVFPYSAVDGLSGANSVEIEVIVSAPGMEIFPDIRQSIRIFPDRDPDMLDFTLIPRELGDTRIEANLYHRRNWLARIQCEVRLVSAQAIVLGGEDTNDSSSETSGDGAFSS